MARHTVRMLPAALLASAAWAQMGGFGGPSILSRGGPASTHRPALLAFRPYVSLSGIYETGLTGFSVDERGRPPDDSTAGFQVGVGAYAYHRWRRTEAGLNYNGDYRYSNRLQYYNGMNHFATFGVTHQPSSRIQVGLRQSAGVFSRAFGSFGGQANYFAPSLVQTPLHAPANELFDNRTVHFSTVGDIVYQRTARLSVGAAGGGFLVRRRAGGLLDVIGAMANGDIAYRLTRRGTIGVNYSFVRFSFSKAFGGADMNMIGLNYAWRVSRFWEFGLLAAAVRLETEAVQRVKVDPIVAAITGLQEGFEAFHQINLIPAYGARLSRGFRHANLTFSYANGVSPGNGLHTTSREETAGMTYSYSGIRRWNLGADVSYSRLSAVGGSPNLGSYSRREAGFGFTRRLFQSDLHLTGRMGVRKYQTSLAGLGHRTQSLFTLGISYSPGDIPLSLW